MLLESVFRRLNILKGGKGPVEARSTFLESLALGLVDPPNLEMTRANRRFILGNSAAITGQAPVQVMPTTQPQWIIWNADTTRTAFYEEIGMYLVSGTPGVGGILLGAIFSSPVPTGSNLAGTSVSPAGKIANITGSSQGTSALIKSNPSVITSPAAPNWYVLATNPSPNVTAFAGSTFLEHRNLQGAIGIPPGFGLALAVVAPAGTTPTFAPFARWVELEVDME